MKRLLSNLISVDERMAILDSYVNDSLSYIVAKRIADRICNDRLCISQYGCFCNTYSQKRVYGHVRNIRRVHKQENIVCTQVEKDIKTGVLILRTVDLTVWSLYISDRFPGVDLGEGQICPRQVSSLKTLITRTTSWIEKLNAFKWVSWIYYTDV